MTYLPQSSPPCIRDCLPLNPRTSLETWRRLTLPFRLARAARVSSPTMAAKQNPPSGIAQLRQSADQHAAGHGGTIESMNLDDFIVPSSIASPSGISISPTSSDLQPTASTATASAIPIRKQQQLQEQDTSSARASAPSVPPTIKLGGNDFDYVQRHVRKTSIDERRVSLAIVPLLPLQFQCTNWRYSLPKDVRMRHLRSHL